MVKTGVKYKHRDREKFHRRKLVKETYLKDFEYLGFYGSDNSSPSEIRLVGLKEFLGITNPLSIETASLQPVQ